MVVTLVSRGGYLRQEIDSQGSQVDHSDPWDPERWAVPLQAKVAVTIEGREVWVRPWLYVLEGATGAKVPVILLDTQLAENDPVDREITDRLYGGDESYRLKQEIVLGVGGLRALRAAGFDVSTYHMNEGHSAFLALELLRQTERKQEKVQARESIYYLPRVREQCVFTTHTPVEAGTDQFSYELVGRVFRDYFDIEELKALGAIFVEELSEVPEGARVTGTIVTVIGARPQFVKAAPLSRLLRPRCREVPPAFEWA